MHCHTHLLTFFRAPERERRTSSNLVGPTPHTPVWRRGGSVEALQRVLRLHQRRGGRLKGHLLRLRILVEDPKSTMPARQAPTLQLRMSAGCGSGYGDPKGDWGRRCWCETRATPHRASERGGVVSFVVSG